MKQLHECDLVMKGGIASGLVYPAAIRRLAQTYRFRSIGGSSAGAIGAAAAAAAEYRRQKDGTDEGFTRLGTLPDALSGERLRDLFEPHPNAPTHFAWHIVREAIADDTVRARVIGALLMTLKGGWIGTLAGVALTAIAMYGATWFGMLASLLLGVLITVGLGALACLWRMREALGDNWMGITRGLGCDDEKGSRCLTRFLHTEINGIAGKPADTPLTLGELATYGIELKAMTTALSHGRPYQLPFAEGERFFFLPEDLRELLPEPVVQHMVDRSDAWTAVLEAERGKPFAVPKAPPG